MYRAPTAILFVASRCAWGSQRAVGLTPHSQPPALPSPRWAMEGSFMWPRVLRSRAHMTVYWDSRAGSAARFLHSGRESVFVFCLLSFVSAPPPVGLGRGAQPKTDQGERLFEPKASSSLTPFSASTAGCLERSGRTQTIGSPFLLLTFLLATQKKSELLPGNPRPVGKPRQLRSQRT